MADLEQLVLSIEARTSQFDKALKRVEQNTKTMSTNSSRSIRKFGSSVDRLEKKMSGFGGRVGGYLKAGIFAKLTAEIAGSFDGMLDVVDRIGKTADKIGLTTDALQELQFAGTQTGVEVRAVDLALQRFSRRSAEAADGQGALYKVFKANGVALRDQEGRMRPLLDLLNDYADIIKSAKSQQEQLRLAFVAFDSEGAAFVNTMRQGADGLEDLRSEARRLGIVLGEDLVRDAERINDEFDKLARTISTKLKSAVLSVASYGSFLADLTNDVGDRKVSTLNREIEQLQGTVERYNREADGSLYRVLVGQRDGKGIDRVQAKLEGLIKVRDELVAKQPKKVEPLEIDVFKGFGANDNKPKRAKFSGRKRGKSDEARKRDEVAEAAKRQKQTVDDLVASLGFEAEQLSRTKDEQELHNNLNRAGVTLESDYGQAIKEATAALQAKRTVTEAAEKAQEKLKEQTEKLNEVYSTLGDESIDVLEQMARGTLSTKDAMIQLGFAIARAVVESGKLGSGPLASLLGGGSSGGGNPFGQLFSSIVGAFTGGFGGGTAGGIPTPTFRPRMHGGLVLPGQAHTVGEDGVEKFIPTHAGRIEPNRPLASNDNATGNSPVVINMTVNTPDARSFKQSQGQIATDLARAVGRGQRNM